MVVFSLAALTFFFLAINDTIIDSIYLSVFLAIWEMVLMVIRIW